MKDAQIGIYFQMLWFLYSPSLSYFPIQFKLYMTDPIFVFDKDGVIVDTESTKARIYEDMLLDTYPQHQTAISSYVYETIGRPRLEKFTHIFENIIGMPAEKAQTEAAAYVKASLKKHKVSLAEAPLVPGIKDFFRTSPNLKFVCSAAHKDEVEAHLYGHQLTPFLQDWYSTPEKADVLSMLKRKFQADLVFWGDTYLDYEAAQKANVPFIAVVLPHVTRDFEKFGVPVIQDFSNPNQVLQIVEELIYRSW